MSLCMSAVKRRNSDLPNSSKDDYEPKQMGLGIAGMGRRMKGRQRWATL